MKQFIFYNDDSQDAQMVAENFNTFFNEENGFSVEEIAEINNLGTYQNIIIGMGSVIMRVNDKRL